MKKRFLGGIFLVVGLFSIAGCSTIVHGNKQQVVVKSAPPGAIVMVDGQKQKTPAVFNLKGSDSYNLTVKKKGYETAHRKIDGSFRVGSTIFGNILWLVPGIIVDFVTGAAYDLQDNVDVNMTKN